MRFLCKNKGNIIILQYLIKQIQIKNNIWSTDKKQTQTFWCNLFIYFFFNLDRQWSMSRIRKLLNWRQSDHLSGNGYLLRKLFIMFQNICILMNINHTYDIILDLSVLRTRGEVIHFTSEWTWTHIRFNVNEYSFRTTLWTLRQIFPAHPQNVRDIGHKYKNTFQRK